MKKVASVVSLFLIASLSTGVEAQPIDKAEVSFTPRTIARLGNDLFMVAQPLVLQISGTDHQITVPIGFLTDLASIPRAFHWWQGKVDASMAAAIVHDYLYWYAPCTQEQADAVLLLGMKGMEVGTFTRLAIYGAVRAAGNVAYESNKRRRLAGDVRTLKSEYVYQILNSIVDPHATMESVVKLAQDNGMLSAEIAPSSDRAVCDDAMRQ